MTAKNTKIPPIMDVYEISDDLVRKLADWKLIGIASGKFNSLPDNNAKVKFVENTLLEFKYFDKIKLNCTLRASKCNKRSEEFRMLGNKQFSLKQRNYFHALELYNKSICFSEMNSENISIGYANRSAVLFEWKKYRECLENIEMARMANYPKRLQHKLDKREKDCIQLLEKQEPEIVPYTFEMTYDRHPVIPSIADCLELRSSKELGRYICTNRDLAVGDVVAFEEPFASSLLAPMRYIRCANCKRENYLTLIPCPNCTSAMFCSEICLEEAHDTFHKFECPIIDFIFTMFNKIHQIALRTCLTALSIFPNIDEFIAFCEDPNNQDQSVFTIDQTNLTPREHYRAIHGLVTNQGQRSTSDLFQRAVVCAVLKRFVIEHTPLKEFLCGIKGENFFTELLFKHLQTSPSNMHGIDLVEQVNETKDDQTFAGGAYAFFSLLNHSCAPNTIRIYKGTQAILFVLRPISANGILYDNYGNHFALQRKKDRIENLQMQYRFTCKCEACEGEYPMFSEIQPKPGVPYVNNEVDMERLMNYDWEFALSKYRDYCEILNQYAHYYPCAQIGHAEESLKMALHILVDAVPLKAKKQATNLPQEKLN